MLIRFIDVNVDGCGTVIETLAKVECSGITYGTIDRIKDSINQYKMENEGEWDTDGCLEAARAQLEYEGYEVHFIEPEIDICF